MDFRFGGFVPLGIARDDEITAEIIPLHRHNDHFVGDAFAVGAFKIDLIGACASHLIGSGSKDLIIRNFKQVLHQVGGNSFSLGFHIGKGVDGSVNVPKIIHHHTAAFSLIDKNRLLLNPRIIRRDLNRSVEDAKILRHHFRWRFCSRLWVCCRFRITRLRLADDRRRLADDRRIPTAAPSCRPFFPSARKRDRKDNTKGDHRQQPTAGNPGNHRIGFHIGKEPGERRGLSCRSTPAVIGGLLIGNLPVAFLPVSGSLGALADAGRHLILYGNAPVQCPDECLHIGETILGFYRQRFHDGVFHISRNTEPQLRRPFHGIPMDPFHRIWRKLPGNAAVQGSAHGVNIRPRSLIAVAGILFLRRVAMF